MFITMIGRDHGSFSHELSVRINNRGPGGNGIPGDRTMRLARRPYFPSGAVIGRASFHL
jgi:hypothetical protein